MRSALGRRALVLGTTGAAFGCGRGSRQARPDAASHTLRSLPLPSANATGVGLVERSFTESPTPSGASDAKRDATTPSGYTRLDWSFEGASSRGGAERAVVLVPGGAPGQQYPVLVALHGRGEAVRGAEAGAYGWVRDYQVQAQLDALLRGRLTPDDFHAIVTPARLEAINASLAATPYAGIILVCPHTPDIRSGPHDLAIAEQYGAWLTRELLPRVRSACPALDGAVGIDGVSLGGHMAWLAGTAQAATFAAIGTLQPAFQQSEVASLVRDAKAYRAARPQGLLRLVTSDGDPFRPVIASLHEALLAEGISHGYLVLPGPHDYIFNRGPGGIEMLLWHDRVLRGATPV